MAHRQRRPPRDTVDAILEQWATVRPDLDASPIAVIGRVSRLSRLLDRELAANFRRFGLENWMYDVLATLRRSGEPYQLTAGELVGHTMVTTGAITNRLDRLERVGYVARTIGEDRRQVIVRLTPSGRALVDEVAPFHLDTERRILAPLTPSQQRTLAFLLRSTLIHLGDVPAARDRSDNPAVPGPEHRSRPATR